MPPKFSVNCNIQPDIFLENVQVFYFELHTIYTRMIIIDIIILLLPASKYLTFRVIFFLARNTIGILEGIIYYFYTIHPMP